MARIFWFRRDLRLQDNIALNASISAAINDGDSSVYPAYFVDMTSFNSLAGIRQHSLAASLDSLGASLSRNLTIKKCESSIEAAVAEFAQATNAEAVHATEAFDPQGVAEQNRVRASLSSVGIELHLHDSYYAVAPGSVAKPDGLPYRVYTPFQRAWMQVGWSNPQALTDLGAFQWAFNEGLCDGKLTATKSSPFPIRAGEDFALKTWKRFQAQRLNNYDEHRNRADLGGTSHLSHALAFGEIHPRTLLQNLGDSDAENVFRKEIAWREFYADVLWHNPRSLTEYYDPKFARMRYDEPGEKFEAWKKGETGYPMVDAGMRQLLSDGWIHNRVRMIVASFLVKDLHLEWQQGARWFEQNLSDFDPASNAHGWQWTAGCGTDASPYYRVFNPVLQGLKFDPDGDYVRKYIPELRHISNSAVHEPWNLIDGLVHGYPAPIVDHSAERQESLQRLEELKF